MTTFQMYSGTRRPKIGEYIFFEDDQWKVGKVVEETDEDITVALHHKMTNAAYKPMFIGEAELLKVVSKSKVAPNFRFNLTKTGKLPKVAKEFIGRLDVLIR